MKTALILAAALAGCTKAGPFITHIQNAGGGRIAVESCYVEYTMFVNAIDTGTCTHYVVHVNDQPSAINPSLPQLRPDRAELTGTRRDSPGRTLTEPRDR